MMFVREVLLPYLSLNLCGLNYRKYLKPLFPLTLFLFI
jgi:hypothetical protein